MGRQCCNLIATQYLLEKGVTLVTNVRKNMKAKAMSLWDRAMLSRRFIIETIKKIYPK